MDTTDKSARIEGQPKRRWQRPSLMSAGTLSEILEGGGGKVTTVTGDPGEPRKVPGMDK